MFELCNERKYFTIIFLDVVEVYSECNGTV
jgi:hypothetical protein